MNGSEEWRESQRVLVTTERDPSYTALCLVESVLVTERLPEIVGAPPAQEVQNILVECGIRRLLLLSFDREEDRVFFIALECWDGKFRDVQKHVLTLTRTDLPPGVTQ